MLNRKIKRIIESANIINEAEELGLKPWQAPSFLFFVMGMVAIGAMLGLFQFSKHYDNPEILIISEVIIVVIIMLVGTFIIRGVEEMARANKIRTEFVSVASHQLKTPLSEANWQVELLLTMYRSGMSEKQIEIMDGVTVSLRRMTRLVSDLLDVARIEQGRFVLLQEKVDVVRSIEEAIKEIEIVAKASGATLEFHHDQTIPTFNGDHRRFRMVIDNLLSNAVKYIGKQGRVAITAKVKDEKIIVEVEDNGLGIPDDQQSKVFKKFFRSDNVVKNQVEGTGLGLYIAKNIIEQSGGEIWFKSIEGIGTKFSFYLPIGVNN